MRRDLLWMVLLAGLAGGSGCAVGSRGTVLSLETQNRALAEQNKAHLAEIANLKTHARKLEDQLVDAERQLAAGGAPGVRQRLARQQPAGAVQDEAHRPASAERLAELARQHDYLRFDPQTGVCKLRHDVLFDSGDTQLNATSRRQLDEFLALLKSNAGRNLRVMIVGHTDDQPVTPGNTRQRYADNWQLSSARALAVAEFLTAGGVRQEQLGVASFGAHQPVAPNSDEVQRRLNRRVEVFILGDDVPIVGWTESSPSLY